MAPANNSGSASSEAPTPLEIAIYLAHEALLSFSEDELCPYNTCYGLLNGLSTSLDAYQSLTILYLLRTKVNFWPSLDAWTSTTPLGSLVLPLGDIYAEAWIP